MMSVTLINVFSVPAAKEAAFVQWWQDVKEHITKHPHVASWWNRVSERPTWQKIVGR